MGSYDSQESSSQNRSRPGINLATMEPTRFGKYTLIAKLGHGGMGEVFLAVSRGVAGFQKLVVIKRLHPQFLDEPEFVEMFLDEARLAARLNHPNVVQTHEVGDVDGLYYLAMEYLEGQSLHRINRFAKRVTGRGLPIEYLARICANALDGLHYAHELRDYDGTHLNVVHRDVSPGNIFVSYQGVAKLLDFGIAKATTQRNVTQTGKIKGKISYMAPEALKKGEVDRRMDLWSMGVLLYEGIVGRPLFQGETELETMEQLLSGKIDPLESTMPQVPQKLAEVVNNALQFDPKARYETAAQMKDDLEEYLSSLEKPPTQQAIGNFVEEIFAEALSQQRERIGTVLRQLEESEGPGESGQPEVEVEGEDEDQPTRLSAHQTDPRLTKNRKFWFALLVMLIGGSVGGWLAVAGAPKEEGSRQVDDAAKQASSGDQGTRTARTRTGGAAQPARQGREKDTGEQQTGDGNKKPSTAETKVAAKTTTDGGAEKSTDKAKAGSEDEKEAEEDRLEEQKRAAARRRRLRRRQRLAAQRRQEKKEAEKQQQQQGQGEDATSSNNEEQDAERQPQKKKRKGFLTFDTNPWSTVTVDGRRLGQTPLFRVQLPAGTHTLTLKNEEAGISTTYRVNIKPNETTTRRIGLQ